MKKNILLVLIFLTSVFGVSSVLASNQDILNIARNIQGYVQTKLSENIYLYNAPSVKATDKVANNYESLISFGCSDSEGKRQASITLEVNGQAVTIPCDITVPTAKVGLSTTGWTSSPVKVIVECSDSQTGCKKTSNFSVSGTDKSKVVIFNDNKICKVGDSSCSGKDVTYTFDIHKNERGSIFFYDIAKNIGSVSYEVKNIDYEDPFININSGNDIPNSKKAGENNIEIIGMVYDDKSVQDTTDLYEKNYDLQYQAEFIGPYKKSGDTEYTGNLAVSEGSIKIKDSGTILNNTEFNKSYSLIYSGIYKFTYTLTDKAGRKYKIEKNIIIYPDDLDGAKSTVQLLNNDEKYANNKDYHEYRLTLKDKFGNFIFSKKPIAIENSCGEVTGGCEFIRLDATNPSSGIATVIYDYTKPTGLGGELLFKIRSFTPGNFTKSFKVELYRWGDDYLDTNKKYFSYISSLGTDSFKKPVVVKKFDISNDGKKWGASPLVGVDQYYLVEIENIGNLGLVYDGEINLNKNTVIHEIEGHKWAGGKNKDGSDVGFNSIKSKFGSDFNKELGFVGKVGVESNALLGPKVKLNNLKITYKLDGKLVGYYLDEADIISGCDIPTLGVKVEGILQGDGKGNLTGQEENFSDLSTAEMRKIIRKNATKLIRGMSGNINDAPVNGVKYVTGNITIGGEIDGYETLIVRNGNVLIESDLNTSGKILGIIVLKDNYAVNTDYKGEGNVFVKNNVKNINAIIYADGTFRSAKNEKGDIYSDLELTTNRLVLNGTLFTRNTIGGAVELITERKGVSSGNYLLPGGKQITDYNLAAYYDLNFVRKVPFCIGDPKPYAILIRYDTRIQTSPPKGFMQ